jgi:multidrug efflux pump subunit AcrA (membrane-fusion protein)
MTITAAQIVADQKSIDSAKANLQVASQNRGLAVLRSPISGTVADLSVHKGDSVSTSAAALSVVGGGRKSVSVNIALAKIDLIKPGEDAQVTVDGQTGPLQARVTQVGLTNTSSSTGSSSAYAVTLVLDATSTRLYDGMGATVAIAVGTAKGVVSAPLSAVSTVGTIHTVRVYANGKVTVTPVTLGVQGTALVAVKSGLHVGQQVVLAEVSAAIPSNDVGPRGFGGGGLTTGLTGGGGGGFVGPPPGR